MYIITWITCRLHTLLHTHYNFKYMACYIVYYMGHYITNYMIMIVITWVTLHKNKIFLQNLLLFSPKTQLFSPNPTAHFSTGHTVVGCGPRPCACGGVTGCLHQQYGTNSRGTFSLGGRAPAHIFGTARKEIATVGTRASRLVLISVDRANLHLYVMLVGIEGICGEAWHCPHIKHHSMLLEMVGPDELIRVSKNQAYAMRITSYFEKPGRCFEFFVFLWRRSLIGAIDCAE